MMKKIKKAVDCLPIGRAFGLQTYFSSTAWPSNQHRRGAQTRNKLLVPCAVGRPKWFNYDYGFHPIPDLCAQRSSRCGWDQAIKHPCSVRIRDSSFPDHKGFAGLGDDSKWGEKKGFEGIHVTHATIDRFEKNLWTWAMNKLFQLIYASKRVTWPFTCM